VVRRGEDDDGLATQVIAGFERLGVALRSNAWSEGFARGLTPTQGKVLTTLKGHSGAGLRLSAIAEALDVSAATASDAVNSLVGKGLVQKTQAADDKRALELSLTRKGTAEARAAAGWPSFLMDAVGHLPREDQTTILRGVVHIIGELQRSGHIPLAQMCVSCRYFRANAHPKGPRHHHCNLLESAIGDVELRVHCPEHEGAPQELLEENWAKFTSVSAGAKATGTAGAKKRRLPIR
jgi:DNA-binding MarR family transcriptional regulator